MATILLIGPDAPLLEGLTQTLSASGHRPLIASGLAEAAQLAAAEPPLIAVVQRSLALEGADILRLRLAPGGTLVLYRTRTEPNLAPLSPSLQRAAIADLTLPLERHRLIALVQYVVARASITGRGPHQTPERHERIR